MIKIKKLLSSDAVIAIILFLVACGIRTIPEIKAGIWPIGYDTFNTYAAEIANYHGSLINWLKTANLLYFFFWPFYKLGFEPGLIMKIFGPIFFGGVVVSFYFWVRKFLKFNILLSFISGLLIVFQLATLRMSWDLYRNELALIFLFIFLINFKKIEKTTNLIFACLFAGLIGLTNELVSATLLILLLIYFLNALWHKKYVIFLKSIVPFALLSIVFYFVIHFSKTTLYSPHIIFTSETNNLIWRYLYQYDKDTTFQQLMTNIVSLFWLMYQFLLPFALLGFWFLRRNLILSTLTLWLVAGTFSSLFLGGTGIIVWDRWLIMLAFPFAVYTVYAAERIGQYIVIKSKKWHFYNHAFMTTLAAIFWIGFLSLFIWRAWPFLTKSYPEAKPPLANDELNKYLPRTMIHNSVGIWKIENTLNCVNWLDQNVPSGAIILVDNRYRGLMLTHFNLDDRLIITNAWSQAWPQNSFKYAKENNIKDIYLIWNVMTVKGFEKVYSSGIVGVYKAKPFFSQ